MGSASALHLSFGDHMYDFDAANRNPGAAKSLEPQHGSGAPLDRPMVLLDEVVEIFGVPPTSRSAESMKSKAYHARMMASCVPFCGKVPSFPSKALRANGVRFRPNPEKGTPMDNAQAP
jgi:hypothetical protein